MLIYTAELVPTFCRSSVMGMCGQASRLGSFVAPFCSCWGHSWALWQDAARWDISRLKMLQLSRLLLRKAR